MVLGVTNVDDGEVIHQTCLLLSGTCALDTSSASDHVTVTNVDPLRNTSATQAWLAAERKWKALVLLHCGMNNIKIAHGFETISLNLTHHPYLQLPPLHLAILVARDSPLVINCPSEKYGAFSSAHNSLDAAIAKLRMSAYMWQALTAERMRKAGLGRRAFRLEEEWQSDLTSLFGVMKGARGEQIMVPEDFHCGARHTMSDHCSLGQANFLRQVYSAFGAGVHNDASCCNAEVKTWAANFIVAGPSTESDGDWNLVQSAGPYDGSLRNMLRLKLDPHFRLPHDGLPVRRESRSARIEMRVSGPEEEREEGQVTISIFSTAGLASVFFDGGKQQQRRDIRHGGSCETFMYASLVEYDRTRPLKIVAMDMVGKLRVVNNGWSLLQPIPFMSFSGSEQRLRLQSFPVIERADGEECEDHNRDTSWTMLLHKRSSIGDLVRAVAIDLRVGGWFDGIVVHYADGSTHGSHSRGGHLSEKGSLAADSRIVKVELSYTHGDLRGIRMTLDGGTQWGALGEVYQDEYDEDDGDDGEYRDGYRYRSGYRVVVLEPGANEKIIGFSGNGDPYVDRFGIITAPIDLEVADISVQMS
ncbi:uncharacterized protein MYCGRDRAFT_109942 [Zymoseptoria tritici IPO323]|uniref:Jacalin-type lectin domain-containing protein n=1 Tax=Zymoseptoria tritici (strain CBS 115943 / IPO323) TaxID=336722 RepID=F9XDS7_ZYMTI|nr:uncharacterized protein MYCGRDRAFT_109942 [Zymoseptoria tritici IPO323]EGP86546.1 hypothetical protein MYCGRDRAFT_109942 [Zymoseptoria tritici IPO323]